MFLLCYVSGLVILLGDVIPDETNQGVSATTVQFEQQFMEIEWFLQFVVHLKIGVKMS